MYRACDPCADSVAPRRLASRSSSALGGARAGAPGAAAARAEGARRVLQGRRSSAVRRAKTSVSAALRLLEARSSSQDWKRGRAVARSRPSPDEGDRWFDDRLEIKGSTGARHLAEWTGDVWVTATLDARRRQGPRRLPDPRGRRRLVRHVHARRDVLPRLGREGRRPAQHHQVRQAVARGRQRRGLHRLPLRGPAARRRRRSRRATPCRSPSASRRASSRWTRADFELRGRATAARSFKTYRPGFYAIKGRMLVDNVTITGRLSDEWLAEGGSRSAPRSPSPRRRRPGSTRQTQALVDRLRRGHRPPPPTWSRRSATPAPPRPPGTPWPRRSPRGRARPSGRCSTCSTARDRVPDLRAGIVKRLLGKDYGFTRRAGEEQRSDGDPTPQRRPEEEPGLLEGYPRAGDRASAGGTSPEETKATETCADADGSPWRVALAARSPPRGSTPWRAEVGAAAVAAAGGGGGGGRGGGWRLGGGRGGGMGGGRRLGGCGGGMGGGIGGVGRRRLRARFGIGRPRTPTARPPRSGRSLQEHEERKKLIAERRERLMEQDRRSEQEAWLAQRARRGARPHRASRAVDDLRCTLLRARTGAARLDARSACGSASRRWPGGRSRARPRGSSAGSAPATRAAARRPATARGLRREARRPGRRRHGLRAGATPRATRAAGTRRPRRYWKARKANPADFRTHVRYQEVRRKRATSAEELAQATTTRSPPSTRARPRSGCTGCGSTRAAARSRRSRPLLQGSSRKDPDVALELAAPRSRRASGATALKALTDALAGPAPAARGRGCSSSLRPSSLRGRARDGARKRLDEALRQDADRPPRSSAPRAGSTCRTASDEAAARGAEAGAAGARTWIAATSCRPRRSRARASATRPSPRSRPRAARTSRPTDVLLPLADLGRSDGDRGRLHARDRRSTRRCSRRSPTDARALYGPGLGARAPEEVRGGREAVPRRRGRRCPGRRAVHSVGFCAMKQGRVSEAQVQFKKAIDLDPKLVAGATRPGRHLRRAGRTTPRPSSSTRRC